MIILSKKFFSGMHLLTTSICETVPQFNDSLVTQFNKGKGWEQIRKNFWVWKYKKRHQKALQSLRKKENIMSRKSYTPNGGIYLQRVSLLLMNQSLSVENSNSLVVENTFVGDCK